MTDDICYPEYPRLSSILRSTCKQAGKIALVKPTPISIPSLDNDISCQTSHIFHFLSRTPARCQSTKTQKMYPYLKGHSPCSILSLRPQPLSVALEHPYPSVDVFVFPEDIHLA